MLQVRSIWTKVFGLTAALVSVMLIAASASFVISYYKVNDVRLRVSHLANVIVPLNRFVANIDAYSLEEEIRLERALRQIANGTASSIGADANLTLFLSYENKIEQELAKAKAILTQTLNNPEWLSPKDAIEFGRISLLIETIEKELNEYFENAKVIIGQVIEGDPTPFEASISQLENEADRLDDELAVLLKSLDELNSTQALEIEAAETMILSVYLQNFALTFMVFLIGIGFSSLVTTRLVNPVRELTSKSKEISNGNLNIEVLPQSHDEVGQLALSFNHMAKQLKASTRVKELFGKYVDPRIVESLLHQSPDGVAFDGSKQEMSIFFSDVKGFSSMSEQLTASGLVRLINRYFSLMAEPIMSEKGVIDKYVGDSIMAFWGEPFINEPQNASSACRAALAQFEQLRKLNDELPEILGVIKSVPDFEIRIGLATGEVLSGNIGSENAQSYTVMGDAVNIASRLESLNKKYGTSILIDHPTKEKIGNNFEFREIDKVTVAGKEDPTRIYELVSTAGSSPHDPKLMEYYELGLAAYREMRWDEAQASFESCLSVRPTDGPSLLMIERIKLLKESPPDKNWQGIWRFKTK